MVRQIRQNQGYNITSAGISGADDRRRREKFYVISMLLRFLCVLSLFFVRGPWLVIPLLGAIFLPYFAVMIGNAINTGTDEENSEIEKLALESKPEQASNNPSEILLDEQGNIIETN